MDPLTYSNQTTAHSDSLMRTTFLVFNCCVLTLTLVLGLPGNLWVCWVVFRTKSLRTCNNALLVSLAANDLLTCSVRTPLLLFSFLHHGEDSWVSVPVCTLQRFTHALCSCVQLHTLVSISVERYRAIAFPLQSERKGRACLWILSIWACGLILALVSLSLPETMFFFMLCRLHTDKHGDERPAYWDPFGPYVLVPVWGLSLTVIIIHYVRIFIVVRQHRNTVLHLGVQQRPAARLHVGPGLLRAPPSAPRTVAWGSVESLAPVGSSSPLPVRRAVLLDEAGVLHTGSSTGGAPGRPPEIMGAVCLLTTEARRRGRTQMERKLAQRFGYIIVAFTLLWMPMVVISLMSVISWQDAEELLMELETSAMVLTCVQAAVDPLIYTLVTRQFRIELGKIISFIPCCPLKGSD